MFDATSSSGSGAPFSSPRRAPLSTRCAHSWRSPSTRRPGSIASCCRGCSTRPATSSTWPTTLAPSASTGCCSGTRTASIPHRRRRSRSTPIDICRATDLAVVLFVVEHSNLRRLDVHGFPADVLDRLAGIDTIVAVKYELGRQQTMNTYETFTTPAGCRRAPIRPDGVQRPDVGGHLRHAVDGDEQLRVLRVVRPATPRHAPCREDGGGHGASTGEFSRLETLAR